MRSGTPLSASQTAPRRPAGCRFPSAIRAPCRRAAGDVRGRGAGDVHVLQLAIASSILATEGTSWCSPSEPPLAPRRRPSWQSACSGRACSGRVVELQRVPVVEDLRVAFFGLQLDPHVPVLGDPQPPGGAGDHGWTSSPPLCPPLARLAPSSRRLVNVMLALTPWTASESLRRAHRGSRQPAAWPRAWALSRGRRRAPSRSPRRPRRGQARSAGETAAGGGRCSRLWLTSFGVA